jgi:hypothetical protein
MGRGLDGYFDIRSLALCSFEGPRRAVLARLGRGHAVLTSFRWLWRGGNTSSLSEQSR